MKLDIAIKYANDCVSGEVVANEDRILACKRFLKMLEMEEYELKTDGVERIIKNIETMFVHVKGDKYRNKPIKLEPWQIFCTYGMLGFYYKGTDERVVTEAFIFIPRKNGKTTYMGGFSFSIALEEIEGASSVIIVGNVIKQALESFNFIKKNIHHLGEENNFRIRDSHTEYSIEREFVNGSMRIEAKANKPENNDGLNAPYIICDEIHAYKDPNQYYTIRNSGLAYKNKMLLGITTAGSNKFVLCKTLLKDFKAMLRNDTGYNKFIFICQADNPEDFTNPIEHEKANPNYGITIEPHEILEDSKQAVLNPYLRNEFIMKRLNHFQDSIASYFKDFEYIESDRRFDFALDELIEMKLKWVGGADLSIKHDLCGVCLYTEIKDYIVDDEKINLIVCIPFGFIPVTTADMRARENQIPIYGWKEDNLIDFCNRPVVDYDDVIKWFISMREKGFDIMGIGYDSYNAEEFLELANEHKFDVEVVSQKSISKTSSFRRIEEHIKKKQFYYMHSEAFEYCISNVAAKETGGKNVMYEKISQEYKIDYFDVCVTAGKTYKILKERKELLNKKMEMLM